MTPVSGQISMSSLRSEIMQSGSGQIRLRADAGNRLGYGTSTNVKMSDFYRAWGATVTCSSSTTIYGTDYGYVNGDNGYNGGLGMGSIDDVTITPTLNCNAAFTSAADSAERINFSYPMDNGYAASNLARLCRDNELKTYSATGEGTGITDLPYVLWYDVDFPGSGTVTIALQWNVAAPPPGGPPPPPPPGGGCCFTNDTLVTMADLSTKEINKIKVGDLILSYNPESNQLETNEVSEIITRVNRSMYRFTLENGKNIRASEDHPFYVIGKGYCSMHPQMTMYGYKNLQNVQTIEIGDRFIDKDGNGIAITAIEPIEHFDTVYTFNNKNKSSPNFYADGVLVY